MENKNIETCGKVTGRKHAVLSPSAAHRWMNCTAAPRLEEQVEDSGSDFAREGSLAHAFCALRLKEEISLPTDEEEAEIAELREQYHTPEMANFVDMYYTAVMERFNEARGRTKDAKLLVETRLDFSKFMPEAFGTADAIIVADDLLEVIDFKYGKGVRVEADRNPQMMIYALGALEAFDWEYDIRRVRMTIVQPRLDNFSSMELPVEMLAEWREKTLKPAAVKAFMGGDGAEQKPGEWCRFCKVKGCCKALAGLSMNATKRDPRLLSPEELATEVLPYVDTVKAWVSDVSEYALAQALAGVKYDGFKLVEGRSVRKVKDVEGLCVALAGAGFDEDLIFKRRELKALSDLEKLVGKKKFAGLCGEYIEKPQGKPTLVPESDKRKPWNTAEGDFDGI